MSLVSQVIKARITGQVDPRDLDMVSGMIQDALPPAADLDAIDAAIGKAKTVWEPLFHTPAPSAPTAASQEPPQRYGEIRSNEAKAEARIEETVAAGNPWAPATRSLTRQVFIEANDPTLAAKLKSEVGR